eukprot:tig00021493_g21871.t1
MPGRQGPGAAGRRAAAALLALALLAALAGFACAALEDLYDPGYAERVVKLAAEGSSTEATNLLWDGCNLLFGQAHGPMVDEALAERYLEAFFGAYLAPAYDFEDFQQYTRALRCHGFVSRLAAMTRHRTTDAALEQLLGTGDLRRVLRKALMLYNPRSTVRVERDAIFAADPAAASVWYFTWFDTGNLDAMREEGALERLREHARYCDAAPGLAFWEFNENAYHAFFFSSYLAEDTDRCVKGKINAYVAGAVARALAVSNTPDRRSVALVSSTYTPGSPVHQCLSAFVRALSPGYNVTLLAVGMREGAPVADAASFRAVHHVRRWGAFEELRPVLENDFGALLFTDVGSHALSLFMANTRLAPLMINAHGHPVSSHGSLADLFLSGAALEPPGAAAHYSERLLLLDGLGTAYTPSPAAAAAAPGAKRGCGGPPVLGVVANWYKTNADVLRVLRLVQLASRWDRLTFRFFPAEHAGFAVEWFRRQAAAVLGEAAVEVVPNAAPGDFLAALRNLTAVVDTRPACAVTTCVNALHARVPILTQARPPPPRARRPRRRLGEGRGAGGGAGDGPVVRGAAAAGGPRELVAGDEARLVQALLRVTDDPAHCAALHARVEAADLEQALYGDAPAAAAAFRAAMDALLADPAAARAARAPLRLLNGHLAADPG